MKCKICDHEELENKINNEVCLNCWHLIGQLEKLINLFDYESKHDKEYYRSYIDKLIDYTFS